MTLAAACGDNFVPVGPPLAHSDTLVLAAHEDGTWRPLYELSSIPDEQATYRVGGRSFRGVELVIAVAAFAALLHAATARADCSAPGGVHINEVRYFDQNLLRLGN